jgi:hypothetical protein
MSPSDRRSAVLHGCGPQRAHRIGLVAALLAQAMVLGMTFLMGLGWGGPTWVLALAQAACTLWLIGWLSERGRSVWAQLLPLGSAALTAGLMTVGERMGHTGF